VLEKDQDEVHEMRRGFAERVTPTRLAEQFITSTPRPNIKVFPTTRENLTAAQTLLYGMSPDPSEPGYDAWVKFKDFRIWECEECSFLLW
jgi:hypothetical protein